MSRAEALAADLSRRVEDAATLAAAAGDEQWARVTTTEGWPVGVVVHHIARALERQAGWIDAMLTNGSLHEFSWDETHALNARIAAAPAIKDDVLAVLRREGDRLVALTARLSDEQLDTPAFSYSGKTRPAKFVLGSISTRHLDEHIASVRATLAV